MSNKKGFFKKCFLWVIVLSVLIETSAFATITTTTEKLSMRNAKQLIDEAAQAQSIAYIMEKCIASIPGEPSDVGFGRTRNYYDDEEDTIFNGIYGDEVNVSVGAWLEKSIAGSVRDGEIECWEGNDKILSLFAQTIELSTNEILCNKENPEYAGLIGKVVVGGQGMNRLLNYGCSGTAYSGNYFKYNTGAATNTVYGTEYTTGRDYVKILYNRWRMENLTRNPYLKAWDNLGDFANSNGYYEVYNEFAANCGLNLQPNNSGSSIVTLKEISDDGKEEENYYQYSPNSKSPNNITGNAKRSCSQMAETVNTYYPYYKSSLQAAFRSECNRAVGSAWRFVYDQAIVILSDTDEQKTVTATINGEEKTWTNTIVDAEGNETVRKFTPEEKQEAEKVKDLYESMAEGRMRRESLFADVDSDVWECRAPSGYEVVGEAYIDPGTGVIDDPSGGSVELNCSNSGGAMSLGWIVCPILSWMGDAADGVYTKYVEPSLKVDAQIFKVDNGVKSGWETFRTIANSLFIILLLVVIFSQLTGVGIDNYGIKKILPKLIIVAILINLSYFVCIIAVDLSNILGRGFQAMFEGIGESLTPTLSIPDSNASLSAAGSTAITGVAVLVALVGMVGAVWANPAILLSLLVAALGVVIAIFFLFLLLGAREAAVIVLIVTSPIAMVCYTLPNTKKLFDKWMNLFKGLLLVYPICGLLVGGGNYVSKLLLSAGFAGDGFFKALTAMVVGIVPVFFIPTVLKGSFAAMGNLGAKISGFGDRMRSGATRGIRNSERFKNAQERGLERRTRIKAGLDKDGNAKDMTKLGRFVRGGKRGMARARSQYLRNQDAKTREDSLMGVGYAAAAIGLQKKAERDETADYMTLINNETRNGENTDRLYEMFDEYMAAGNKAGAVAVARIAGRRKDTADDFLRKKITGAKVTKNADGSLSETLSDVSAGYNRKALSSVMKEIATGENSGMYRSSSPLGFEFAAQFNREYREDKNGAPVEGAGEASYGAWRSVVQELPDGKKIYVNSDRAMSNYVTDSRELVGAKNSSLREMNYLIDQGQISSEEVSRLRRLAADTIQNKDVTGVWDTTKAEEIYRMAGLPYPSDGAGTAGAAAGPTTPPDAPAAPIERPREGAAREGESFDLRGAGPAPTSGASDATTSNGEPFIMLSTDPRAQGIISELGSERDMRDASPDQVRKVQRQAQGKGNPPIILT